MTAEVPRLAVEGVTLRFGGITALDDVRFAVEPGTVHALIGPNGAGKSSCFNVISGLYRPTMGAIRFGEDLITWMRPSRLAARGIGRSFQNIALSPGSTVLDNVLLGRHALTRGGFLAAGLRLNVREERRHAARAAEICAFLGIADRLDDPVGVLPYGVAKRVDIARALAVEPTLLLLDEPAAGLNSAETAEMAVVISDLRDALGISVLLVEHDMGLVMGIADRVTVLDFGRVIADGVPAQVQSDPEVIRAYLGSDVEPPGGPGPDPGRGVPPAPTPRPRPAAGPRTDPVPAESSAEERTDRLRPADRRAEPTPGAADAAAQTDRMTR